MNPRGVRRSVRIATGLVVSTLVPRAALACPVCFGVGESQATRGLLWGVLTLVVVTAAVLGGFASFFVRLARRERAATGPAPGCAAGAGTAAPAPTRADRGQRLPDSRPQPEATRA